MKLRGFEQHASMLKSCLQKLIRFQPMQCHVVVGAIDLGTVSSQIALVVVIWSLFHCKGGFNPDLQRYTSGLESLTKRLGVILFEDSSFSDPCDAVRLLGAALLAQRVPEWKPAHGLLITWCKIALAAQANLEAYDYESTFSGCPHIICQDTSSLPLAVASALLDKCGSFDGDEKMARDIASRPLKIVRGSIRPSLMRFPDHCRDQHTCPSMVYFFPRDVIDKVCGDKSQTRGSAPFAPMMTHIFKVTGTNPRRHCQNFEQFDVANSTVMEAQRCTLLALRFKPEKQGKRDTLEGKSNLNLCRTGGLLP